MDQGVAMDDASIRVDSVQQRPELAEFVKLLPGVSSETLLLSYCGVLNSHYSALNSHYSAVASYYSAVAELAKERSIGSPSAVSSTERSAVETVSTDSSGGNSSGSGSVSVGSSASTGKQARRARRRLQKSRKKGLTAEKKLLMASSSWRSSSVDGSKPFADEKVLPAPAVEQRLKSRTAVSEVSTPSVRSSVILARSNEFEAGDVMRRKHDAVVAHGQGFCYLYAVCSSAADQVAKELGPDPIFSDLMAQPADLFEPVSCLAALYVDVSSGIGHIVSSGRSGLTRFWTLCCSIDWREYAAGTLGFSTKGYMACGATFVRQPDFKFGASEPLLKLNERVDEVTGARDGGLGSKATNWDPMAEAQLSVLKSFAVDEGLSDGIHTDSMCFEVFLTPQASGSVIVRTYACNLGEYYTLARPTFGLGVYCFDKGSVLVDENAIASGVRGFSGIDSHVFMRQHGSVTVQTPLLVLARTVCTYFHFSSSFTEDEVLTALKQAGMLHVVAADMSATAYEKFGTYAKAIPNSQVSASGVVKLLKFTARGCAVSEIKRSDFSW